MKSKSIQNDIINLEAIQEGLEKANDINAIGLPRHLISKMIKEKKGQMVNLKLSTDQAFILKDILEQQISLYRHVEKKELRDIITKIEGNYSDYFIFKSIITKIFPNP